MSHTAPRTGAAAAASAIPPPVVNFTMPRTDHGLRDWMNTVATTIAADPERFHLTAAIAADLTARARAFDAALHCAYSPDTRCKQATIDKNNAREAARAAFKPVIDHIRHHAEIDILAKYEIGMKAHCKRQRRPIEPPKSAPMLSITAAGADGTHTLHYADDLTPHKRARPKGAGYLDLHIIIVPGDQGIEGPPHPPHPPVPPHPEGPLPDSAIVRSERITRTPFIIEHNRAHGGRMAIYHARWMTNTNKPGPWGHPVSMTIATGGPPPNVPLEGPPETGSPPPAERSEKGLV